MVHFREYGGLKLEYFGFVKRKRKKKIIHLRHFLEKNMLHMFDFGLSSKSRGAGQLPQIFPKRTLKFVFISI
jgi:hypothetical protein